VSGELSGYRIVERLGRGAGSEILLVADPHTARTFALKRIVVRNPKDHRFVRQAETEYAVAGQLEHPYLRRCIAAHKVRRALRLREYHLVMEYIDGISLQEKRPTDIAAVVDIFIKVARGLDSLHRVGYVHADMKPNNVLIGASGTVKIIDFGQSCKLGAVKNRVQGTPEFIAPEQVEKQPLDARTDVFNLGATLFWVLTGRAMETTYIRRKRSQERRGAYEDDDDPPLTVSELNPVVSEPLSRTVADCCRANMEDRPQSMAHLIARLDAVRPESPPEGDRRTSGAASASTDSAS
jgi:serine/threonine-protein kinase